MKHRAPRSAGSAHTSLCSFEHFLLEWNCWLNFRFDPAREFKFDLKKLDGIAFTTSSNYLYYSLVTGRSYRSLSLA
jgi:hypothetical protein